VKSTALKIAGGVCAIIMIISFVLVLFRVITWKLFWIIAIILAIIAYWGIPWIKRN